MKTSLSGKRSRSRFSWRSVRYSRSLIVRVMNELTCLGLSDGWSGNSSRASNDDPMIILSPVNIPLWFIALRGHAIDPSRVSHNALGKYPTMHNFATEMCTHVHISFTKWCILGYGTSALWNLCNVSIYQHTVLTPNSIIDLCQHRII